FQGYDSYIPAVGPCTKHWDSPVLTKLTHDGALPAPNFNAGCFLKVYDLARDDAITTIQKHPDAWIEGRLWSARRWFALDDGLGHSKSAPWRTLQSGYRIALIGVPGMLVVSNWGMPISPDFVNHFSLLAIACSIAVVAAAGNRRGRDRDVTRYVAFL